jgi:hypothetical protein
MEDVLAAQLQLYGDVGARLEILGLLLDKKEGKEYVHVFTARKERNGVQRNSGDIPSASGQAPQNMILKFYIFQPCPTHLDDFGELEQLRQHGGPRGRRHQQRALVAAAQQRAARAHKLGADLGPVLLLCDCTRFSKYVQQIDSDPKV